MPDQDGVDLPLDECLREVLALQPHWTSENTPEMERRGRIVRKFGPAAMRRVLEARLDPPPFDWSVQGGDGTGLKTRVPWIRVHSKTLSPSATEGWYLVYLFTFDGQAVYLSLNQGTAVTNVGAFKMRPADELTVRADWARTVRPLPAVSVSVGSCADLRFLYMCSSIQVYRIRRITPCLSPRQAPDRHTKYRYGVAVPVGPRCITTWRLPACA
jgi:MrcB-like, N-terminal domain